jgi:hypothetical protein
MFGQSRYREAGDMAGGGRREIDITVASVGDASEMGLGGVPTFQPAGGLASTFQ